MSIFGNRLIVARKMAGMSLQGLADKLEGVISRQALHKYEQNQTLPNSQTLIALSRVLNVPVDFFFSEPEVQVELKGVEFRKRKRLSAADESAVVEQCNETLNRYLTLEEIMQDSKPAEAFSFSKIIETPEDAEEAAQRLRLEWELGTDPIPSVIAMLEDKGYKVIELDAHGDFDGLKAFGGSARVIGINGQHDICRKRFTMLHELAHHLLHFPADMPEDVMERLCHAFSGAVIFPKEQALEAMHPQRFHFYLPELAMLKEYWGISIAAMFARAKNLGIISDHVFAKLNQGYRSRQYHKGEPGRFSGMEKPMRFRQLLYRGLAEEIISINQAATLSQKTVGELRNELDQLA